MPTPRGPGGRVAYRFGLILLPALFFESALGVFSAGAGASPRSDLFDLHVIVGVVILGVALAAFLLVRQREGPAARAASGLVLAATVAVAVVASASLSVGIDTAGLLERLLALAALFGAAGMIAAGYASRRGLPPPAPVAEAPTS